MFNLAAIRFRNVLEAEGGPIASLETRPVTRRGSPEYEANACLRADLAPKRASVLFGAVDGSGTNVVAAIARQVAVSESIERWSLLAGLIEGKARNWGLSVDPTSNGFAAYPGVFARQARPYAWLEGAERWSLFAWWEGLLQSEAIATPATGVRGIRICSPFSCSVVVLFSEPEPGVHAYGYAAASTLAAACQHALLEMDRHAVALRRAARAKGARLTQHEARALFFGGAEGFALFQEHLVKATFPRRMLEIPQAVFDGEIHGEWSRYANVWRVVFRPPSNRFLTDGQDYFWW